MVLPLMEAPVLLLTLKRMSSMTSMLPMGHGPVGAADTLGDNGPGPDPMLTLLPMIPRSANSTSTVCIST